MSTQKKSSQKKEIEEKFSAKKERPETEQKSKPKCSQKETERKESVFCAAAIPDQEVENQSQTTEKNHQMQNESELTLLEENSSPVKTGPSETGILNDKMIQVPSEEPNEHCKEIE